MAPIRTAASTVAAAFLLAVPSLAPAQSVAGSAAVLEVQRLAPQLVSFAVTPANFESLVNGFGTSATPTPATSGTAAVPNAAPSPAVQLQNRR